MNFKKIRRELGISQMELAKISRVSRHRIHLCERGYAKLRKVEIYKIEAALQIIEQKMRATRALRESNENR